MKHLVIGLGEVGTAIQSILECDGFDTKLASQPEGRTYDMIHVCIPYSDSFRESVINYMGMFKAKYVVVHSTVPVGTCDELGVTHSPVRGVHPNLEEGIRTFTKYFGGADAIKVSQVFNDCGIKTWCTENAKTTEALKLWDTTQYGIMIALEKEIHAYCERHDLDFNIVYQDANITYNEGYRELGMARVVRPWLKHVEGPIGGHCVIPNARLLKENEDVENPLVNELLQTNYELTTPQDR